MEKNRYSDEELEEFREIINKKLDKARKNYEILLSSMDGIDGNDITDTMPTYKNLTESATLLAKQETAASAARQKKFIQIP